MLFVGTRTFEQAVADLCQAQLVPGLAMIAMPILLARSTETIHQLLSLTFQHG